MGSNKDNNGSNITMTLINQKDESNQTERKESKTRMSSNNNIQLNGSNKDHSSTKGSTIVNITNTYSKNESLQ
jgi:hypothetical protein